MNKNILLTGATGFIGRNVARMLSDKKYDFTVIVRPETPRKKLADLTGNCEIVELDLADTNSLRDYLAENSFKTIIHLGAIRGGRKFPERIYFDANVKATEQLAGSCLKNDSKFIFCSSVGVYGTIPQELPAGINTSFQSDSIYHETKIKAEAIIQKYSLSGLQAVTIRPAITYGEGDYGFPYKLVRLIHKKLLFLPDTTVRIHLANIDIVTSAFYKLTEDEFKGNRIYILADRYPVKLHELADFISIRLRGQPYPQSRYKSLGFFRKMTSLSSRYGLNSLHDKIKLISNNWFYDSSDAFNDLYLRHAKTIPDFKTVVDWYKSLHHIR